jgi:hypothetical protein
MFTIRQSDTVTKALQESIGLDERKVALEAAVAAIPELTGGVSVCPLRADRVILVAPPTGDWKWPVLLSSLFTTIDGNVVVLNASQPELLEAYSYWRAADYASLETRNAALCLLNAHDAASDAGLIRAAALTFQSDTAATKTAEGILEDGAPLGDDEDDEGDARAWLSDETEESEDEDDEDEEGDELYPSVSAEASAEGQIVPRTAPSALSTCQLEKIGGYDGPNKRAALALATVIELLETECKNKAKSDRAKALAAARDVIPDTEEPLTPNEAEAAARDFIAKLDTRSRVPEKLVKSVRAALVADPDELADMVADAAKDTRDECATVAAMLDPTQAPLKEQEAFEKRVLTHMLAQIRRLEAHIDAHERADKLTPTGALSYALRELRTRRAALARQEAHTAATIARLGAAQRPTITTSAEVLGVTDQWADCLRVVSPESLEEIKRVVNAAWRKAVLPVHADKVVNADAEAKAEAKAAYDRLHAAKEVLLARIAELQASASEPAAPLRARAAKRKARELELERERE